jgi:hypothetical protein
MTIRSDFEDKVAAAKNGGEIDAIVDTTIALVSRRYDRAQLAAVLASARLTPADRRAIARAFLIVIGEA